MRSEKPSELPYVISCGKIGKKDYAQVQAQLLIYNTKRCDFSCVDRYGDFGTKYKFVSKIHAAVIGQLSLSLRLHLQR